MKKLFLLFFFCIIRIVGFAQIDTLNCDAADRDSVEFENLPWFGNNDYLESF